MTLNRCMLLAALGIVLTGCNAKEKTGARTAEPDVNGQRAVKTLEKGVGKTENAFVPGGSVLSSRTSGSKKKTKE